MKTDKRKAVLAAIDLRDNLIDIDNVVSECTSLCEADNIEIVNVIIQKANSLEVKFGFRKGKLDELKQTVIAEDLDLVVFANNLKMSQIVNVAEYLNIDVLDRTNLILDIFKNNAITKEAKLQTEVAYLKYNLQRYLNLDLDIDRESGGMQSKGKGEKISDLKKRKVYQKINQLNEELDHLQLQSEVTRKKQNATNLKKIALVGYTNAGKSSLMNMLLKNNKREDKQVLQKDMLFATLDSTCRKIHLENNDVLVYDTVGFVSDLPHDLIEAFRSSLDVVKKADLLVEVIDASNKDYLLQDAVVTATLKEIAADDIKVIKVYNKIDKADIEIAGLKISCLNNTNIDTLIKVIEAELYKDQIVEMVKVLFKDINKIYQYQNIIKIEELERTDEGILFKLTGDKKIILSITNK